MGKWVLVLFFFTATLTLQAQQLAKLLHQVKTGSNDEKFAAYIKLSKIEKNDSVSKTYVENALKLATENAMGEQIAVAQLLLTDIYFSEKKNELAKLSAQSALKIYQETENEQGILNATFKLANIESAQYNSENALKLYLEVLNLSEKLSEDSIKALTYYRLGRQHYQQRDLKSARKYNKEAEKIYAKRNDLVGKFNVLNNNGLFCHQEKRADSALFYFEAANKVAVLANDSALLAMTYNNIAMVRFEMGEYDGYTDAAFKSLEINRKIGNLHNAATALNNIGYFYHYIGDRKKGIEYLEQSARLAEELDYKNQLMLTFGNLSEVYDSLRNYEQAYRYYRKFSDVKDALFSEQRDKSLSEMNAKYDSEKKEREIELLKKDSEIQRIVTYFVLAALVLALFIAVVFIRQNKQKKRANQILSHKNTEIEQQKEEISAQREELLATNDELQYLNSELEKLSIVARETDNSVVIMSAEGQFEWFNEGFERIYGYTASEYSAANKSIFDVAKSENHKIITQSIAQKKSVIYESEALTKTGEPIVLQTNLIPILDSSGDLKKLTIVETDISKLKLAELQIAKQRDELFVKNENINAAIRYAKTIQNSILPSSELISTYFENFVIFKPKDIVSGDFYWFHKTETAFCFAVVDCTGHGVPGAFMSLIGSRILSEIVSNTKTGSPKDILNQMNTVIVQTLRQSQSSNHDGMDVALCRIEKSEHGTHTLTFAGAKRDVFFYKHKEQKLERLRGQRKSIGGVFSTQNALEYQDIMLDISTGDMLYMFTDGYVDQNNSDRKRFGTPKFESLVTSLANLPLDIQKQKLETELNQWKINELQRDDITILAIKI